MDDFKKINKDTHMSILLNIHHVELALDYADRVIGIRKGQVVYDGKASDVTQPILDLIYGNVQVQDELSVNPTLQPQS